MVQGQVINLEKEIKIEIQVLLFAEESKKFLESFFLIVFFNTLGNVKLNMFETQTHSKCAWQANQMDV